MPQGAVEKGANLPTHTLVTPVSKKPPDNSRWEVTTAWAATKSKTVLIHQAVHLAHIPAAQAHIVPVRGICSRIVVPEGRAAPFLPQTCSNRHGLSTYDYSIPRNDGSIIVGGGKSKF
ncbi:hypothetical protein QBC33DRAFT_564511 [Phialemonium atrogriseum]|uniref:Uncharacterized protein n=1 Tax=Phialemonium atrogriseum TaxID=1093897 RepID=A0AAJ0BNS2_9PEZI|nr:uncharacterized protein QBC33DRAFT_564511 [Phialemonium atrogriseum]KAK1761705.1 hypothetical protein QBC33DRAFT_564511 [Phialemonium atrogriseum]